MYLKNVMRAYLEYVYYNKTYGTYDSESRHLKIVIEYLTKNNYVTTNQISENMIYNLVSYLYNDRKNCTNTINKKIGVLRRSLDYSDIEYNHKLFKNRRFTEKHFNYLSENELQYVIKYFDSLDLNNTVNLTNYVLFYLLLYTGVRRTELSNIKVNEIDLDNSCIYLNKTKTHKPRIVMYKSTLNKFIKKYIDLYPEREMLFYDIDKQHNLSPDHITAKFRYMNNKLKIRHFTPHVLRHTLATLLINNGATEKAVQMLLGHEKITTTQIYSRMNVNTIRNNYNKCFPEI